MNQSKEKDSLTNLIAFYMNFVKLLDTYLVINSINLFIYIGKFIRSKYRMDIQENRKYQRNSHI